MSTTNILDLNNRIDALEKIAHNVEPIQQQIDELKAWTDSGTKDASGNPIILTDGSAFNAVDLKVSLSPKQSGSGTPSPQNVRPITGYTECVVTVKDEDETTQDTATIAFGQTVYGGSVDFKTGKVMVTHGFITLDGDANTNYGFYNPWYGASDYTKYMGRTASNVGNKMPASASAAPIAISDKFNALPEAQRPTVGSITASSNFANALYLNFGEASGLDTTEKQLAWLADNPVNICYELETPLDLTLTPAELDLLKGYNHITSNGDNIELTYMPDTLKADILLTVSQLYGDKISIMDGILTGGTTGQVLTKTSDDNYAATWETLPATRTTTRKTIKEEK